MHRKIAIFSLDDLLNAVWLANQLTYEHNYDIYGTSGTYRFLRASGIPVRPMEELTGYKMFLDGQIKTISEKVALGILADRSSPTHRQQVKQRGARLIDLVVVNFPRFDRIVERAISAEEKRALIDEGGHLLLRLGAKNPDFVSVLNDPADYARLVARLGKRDQLRSFNEEMAVKAFEVVSLYDMQVSEWIASHPRET